ncbi:MAG: indole-3-glycerol phosphate synthase TrpC, partial [Candidatus Dadabacteria bacterium]|nr:indole-3-glycerol phosphate synthase TrpC [Candidatus Dadabacteria bacterium]NIQ13834.1 indole-3-glycerol phosphate synthase TrpC [Candidatus Dadabacteria bacterium]
MILDEIIDYKKEELKEVKLNLTLSEIKSRIKDLDDPLDFIKLNKSCSGNKIISEIKKASPSKGIIREDFNHIELAKEYQEAGAFAISVLTDKKFFMGNITFLSDIRKITNIPLLRKDFTIDPYQIYEARCFGADVILLIVAALDLTEIKEYMDIAKFLGMNSIVEVHTEQELQTALDARSEIIGINNRDLKTFEVSLDVSIELSKFIPDDIIVVGESGISNKEDIKRL